MLKSKKSELLLPVGNMNMCLAAIHNGADAIYVGMPHFNARGRTTDFEVAELKEIIENPDIGEILVLTIDDTIVAMVSLLYSISTALGGKVAVLEDMIVDEEYRKKNYGAELINEAIQYARNSNILRLTLLTDFDNDKAIRFYTNAGFEKSKMIPMRLILNINE